MARIDVQEAIAQCLCHQSMLPYKTWKSLLWFVLTWLVTIGTVVSVATSYWLIGPPDVEGKTTHFSFFQDCSLSETGIFACTGMRTNTEPIVLLVVMSIMGMGVVSLLILTVLTLTYCFCDQLTACGRSFHTLAGIWQAVSSMLTLIGIALFPVVWDHAVITNICKTSERYHIGDCMPGYSMYLGVVCCVLGYILAAFSTSLDSDSFKITRFASMESLDTYKQREI